MSGETEFEMSSNEPVSWRRMKIPYFDGFVKCMVYRIELIYVVLKTLYRAIYDIEYGKTA